jgi:hypothetical protein
LVVDVSNGTLSLNADGSFTYSPDTGYVGNDSFTYVANDSQADSNVAIVDITITDPAPVIATFGLDNGNATWGESSDILNVMRFQNTAGTGTLTQLELMFNDSSPNGMVRLGIYADNNGMPGSLLLDAGEVEVQNGWVSIDGLSLSVTENTYYWLAYNMENPNDVRYQTGRPSASHRWATVSYGAFPNQYPVSSSGNNNNQYIMRATVTVDEP